MQKIKIIYMINYHNVFTPDARFLITIIAFSLLHHGISWLFVANLLLQPKGKMWRSILY